jgi:hypothetical protein
MKKIGFWAITLFLLMSTIFVATENLSHGDIDISSFYDYPDTEISGVLTDDPDLKDNAAHFKYYQNDSHIIHWYEWWYLNVKDDNGINLVIEFFTFGNLNNPFTSLVGIWCLILNENDTLISIKSYPWIEYSLGYEKCNVNIDGDIFLAVNRDHYILTYHNNINDVSLYLNVSCVTQGIRGVPQKTQGWEWMEWIVPIPYGRVEGILHYNNVGKSHTNVINGLAYHDHNWGISKKISPEWDWGEFTDTRYPLSFTYGLVTFDDAEYVGGVYITNDTTGESIYLPDLHFEYKEWLKISGIKKPSLIHVYGANSTVAVDIIISLQKYYIMGSDSLGLPYLFGHATGSIMIDGQLYTIDATGFYEHHFIFI